MSTKRMWAFSLVGALTIALYVAGSVLAKEHAGAGAKGGEGLGMSKFYAGTHAQVGEFPGKLVCLACDLKGGPEAMAQCAKEGHRHALSMDGSSMIHPLLPASEEVLKQINSGELHGKQVKVHGKFYNTTGVILVDRISESK